MNLVWKVNGFQESMRKKSDERMVKYTERLYNGRTGKGELNMQF